MGLRLKMSLVAMLLVITLALSQPSRYHEPSDVSSIVSLLEAFDEDDDGALTEDELKDGLQEYFENIQRNVENVLNLAGHYKGSISMNKVYRLAENQNEAEPGIFLRSKADARVFDFLPTNCPLIDEKG